MLKLTRVSKFYSSNGVVSAGFSKVDLELQMGEFVAITGESGSGKSTLLNVISGLDSFEEGEMYVNGEPTSGFSRADLEKYRKEYIGSIFQTFNLINSYTVYQNIELILQLSGYDKKQIPEKVKDIIEKVGLSGLEKKKASKLSGGQKQRVAIARALAKETPIIVADEPTGNLDSQSAADIIRLLHQLSKDKLIIVVTHNYEQVEPYVTRKITMHDGRIAEDKKLTTVQDPCWNREPLVAKADGLSLTNKIRLGMRNAFNIPAKFALLLTVFLFLCGSVMYQYASYQNMNDSMNSGWNEFFTYTGEDRILITKENHGEFTKADYEVLGSIENVKEVVENDLLLDLVGSVSGASEDNNFWTTVRFDGIEDYRDQLVEGKLPEKKNEAVLMVAKDSYAAMEIGQIFQKKADIYDDYTGAPLFTTDIIIVGYGYLTSEQEQQLEESGYYCDGYLCLDGGAIEEMRMASLLRYCSHEIRFADNIIDGNAYYYPIFPSDRVPEGEIYIPEEIAYLSEYEAYGQSLSIKNKSLYFEEDFDFTVGAVYGQDNCYYYLGIEDWEETDQTILYISQEDYKRIFSKGNFQSSILTEDTRMTKETAKAIEDAGYKTFVVSEGKVDYDQDFALILNILRGFMLAAVLIVLFFITYFIVKLILKSRNIYFSTIRMLGATKDNCSSLLKIELFVIFNLAYFLCAGFAVLAKKEVVDAGMVTEIIGYLTAGDFVILYIILCVMSFLLAARYAKQLFGKSAMNAYKEEV